MAAKTVASGVTEGICGPFFDANDILHFLSRSNGDVYALDPQSNAVVKVTNAGGAAHGACMDSTGALVLCNTSQGSIVRVSGGDNKVVCEDYEDKPLKGPHSVALDDRDQMFFTDSGPMGETGLHNARGSVYMVANGTLDAEDAAGATGLGGSYLRPIFFESLAYPTGIATSKDGKVLYVCEMMTNRVLRACQRPRGVFHTSVFLQLSGGVGPSAIAVDSQGNLYVATFEMAGLAAEGRITVVSSTGVVSRTLTVPSPEITGLALSPNETSLFVTEESTGSLFEVPL